MKNVKIRFDYLQGPVWKDKFDLSSGEMSTGIKCIDNDITIQTLNDKAGELYSSLYKFDEHGKPCTFNEQGYEAVRLQLLGLVQTIIYRLQEINDGSFAVVDEATADLMAAKPKVS